MALREEFEAVLAGVPQALTEPFKGHPLAARTRGDAADAVRQLVADESYKVEGSPGKGRWGQTVWVSVFDRLITETAQEGFYVVYLFRSDGAGVYVSLNQGTTAILREAGRPAYVGVLRDTADRDAGLLAQEDLGGLITGPIDLGATTEMSKGYEAGNILALYYAAGSVPGDSELANDLTHLLGLYASLAEARAELAAEEQNVSDPAPETEAKRYRWHRLAERNRSLAKKAKKVHGDACQVCGVRLEAIYGAVGQGYIEAHHLTPFADLNGRPKELNPATDFAVVCPNCHRMLHKGPPYTVTELQGLMAGAGG